MLYTYLVDVVNKVFQKFSLTNRERKEKGRGEGEQIGKRKETEEEEGGKDGR